MESSAHTNSDNFYGDLAALDWQIELGADEAISELPVNRYELPEKTAKPVQAETVQKTEPAAAVETPSTEHIALSCLTLTDLQKTLEGFDGCAQKQGARHTIFAGGNPDARVMIISNAPNRDEDREGQIFIGQTGQLLEKMLAAIGLTRDSKNAKDSFYFAPVFPWRAPQNRDPDKTDLALMRPFLLRHIAMAKPDILLLMGNSATKTLLGNDQNLLQLRGQWQEVNGIPALPILHPEALLRKPLQKRDAWVDLLAVKARLNEKPQ